MRKARLVILGAVVMAFTVPSPNVGAADSIWYCGGLTVNYDTGESPAIMNNHGDQWPISGATFVGQMSGLYTHHETFAAYFQSHTGHTSCD
jgi:hypothetical protein